MRHSDRVSEEAQTERLAALAARKVSLKAEKRAAMDIVRRAFDRGLYAQVFYEDGGRATPITQDSRRISAELQATSLETVLFLRREKSSRGSRRSYQRVGWVAFVWGNSPEEVASDYSDNDITRSIVDGDQEGR